MGALYIKFSNTPIYNCFYFYLGPLKEEIQKFYQAARADANERIPLFRLAWDASMSAFGTRQALYEHFFFGDPVRMAGALCANHDRTKYMDTVREFLARAKAES